MTPVAMDHPLVRELLDAPLIARLATHNGDGTIHLVAVWFGWDGEAMYIPTRGDQRKVRNVKADSRVTVLVDDSHAGFDIFGVMIMGNADVLVGSSALEQNRRVHLRYVDDVDLSLEPVRRSLGTDDATIRIVPQRAVAWDYRTIERERLRLREHERLQHAHGANAHNSER